MSRVERERLEESRVGRERTDDCRVGREGECRVGREGECRVLVLGEEGVGKSALIHSFSSGYWVQVRLLM